MVVVVVVAVRGERKYVMLIGARYTGVVGIRVSVSVRVSIIVRGSD